MKILVTGGAGFIGSAVVRLAVRRGHEVVNLDALTYAANLEKLALTTAAEVVAAVFVVDLPDLGGAERLRAAGVPVETLVAFEGD